MYFKVVIALSIYLIRDVHFLYVIDYSNEKYCSNVNIPQYFLCFFVRLFCMTYPNRSMASHFVAASNGFINRQIFDQIMNGICIIFHFNAYILT